VGYREQLASWCIACTKRNRGSRIVARFRHRNDAIAHQQFLQRYVPGATYTVLFDPPDPSPDSGEFAESES